MSRSKVWKGENAPEIARIVGEARLRALQQVDAPFLTAGSRDVGFIARTSNGFSSVETFGEAPGALGDPWLFLSFEKYNPDSSRQLGVFALDTDSFPRETWELSLASEALDYFSPGGFVGVGDGYVIKILLTGTGGYGVPLMAYMNAFRVRSATQSPSGWFSESSGDKKRGYSVVFDQSAVRPVHSTDYDLHPITGTGQLGAFSSGAQVVDNANLVSLAASGYSAEADGHRFAWFVTQYLVKKFLDDPGSSGGIWVMRTQHVLHVADTNTLAASSRSMLYYDDRENYLGPLQCAGHGRLAYLLIPKDLMPDQYSGDIITLLPKQSPYLVISNDHGDSWAPIEFSQIESAIDTATASSDGVTNRPFRNPQREQAVAMKTRIIYVGNGVSLLVVPTESSESEDASSSMITRFIYQPRLYRLEGSTITRLNWLADEWAYPDIGEENAVDRLESGWMADAAHANLCFGQGCAVFTMRTAAGERKLLFTHDYGDTWAVSPAIPEYLFTVPITISPKTESSDGEVWFSTLMLNDGRLNASVVKTTGLFDEFSPPKKRNKLKKSGEGIEGASIGAAIYVGQQNLARPDRPPYVNSALPGEFDRP